MEALDIKKSCCFTGHRPEKLSMSEKEVKALLCHGIQRAIDRGYRIFITGMAKGVDTWAGEMVMEFKNIYPDIKLVCAIPYPTFAKGSTSEEKLIRQKMLDTASIVHISSPTYSPFSFQSRNMWMVDNSSLVIAFFTGEPGGTRNTINYAKSQNREIMNLIN
ncbi:MAG: DUF1273 family protein [Clostridia bacterium]|nr:DUF1273 family protein [Clostridia bacterium]